MSKIGIFVLSIVIILSSVFFALRGLQIIQIEPLWLIAGIIYSVILHVAFYKTSNSTGKATKFVLWLENSVIFYPVILFLIILGVLNFIGFAYSVLHGELSSVSDRVGAGADSILLIVISMALISGKFEKINSLQ
jgi:uncharacterized membrane protein YhdT